MVTERHLATERQPTILVADDTAACRVPLVQLLQMMGYRVISANNGQEALQLLETSSPDLVILDLSMPVMDGFGFLKAIRQSAKWRKLPVMIFTASDDQCEEHDLLRRYNVEFCLRKGSVTFDDLSTYINVALSCCAAA